MRRTPWLVLLLLLLFAGGAQAQPFYPAVPPAENPRPGPVMDHIPETLVPLPPNPAELWSADLLLGLPTGLRLQRLLDREGAPCFQAEVFAGLDLIFPMVGSGLRYRFEPCRGRTDCLAISPGIDLYLLYNPLHDNGGIFGGGPRRMGFLTLDVDFIWEHAWSERWQGHCGLKLGAGITRGDDELIGLPVVSLFLGCRF